MYGQSPQKREGRRIRFWAKGLTTRGEGTECVQRLIYSGEVCPGGSGGADSPYGENEVEEWVD